MLLTQADRNLHREVNDRLATLDAWLGTPAHAGIAARVWPAVDAFHTRWAEVDQGFRSDPTQMRAAHRAFSTVLEGVKEAVAAKTVGGNASPYGLHVDARMVTAAPPVDPRVGGGPHTPFGGLGVQSVGGPGTLQPADQPTSVPFSWLPDWLNPYAPSAEMERAVREAADAWAKLEPQLAARPALATALKGQHDTWTAFYARWQSGDKDVGAVNAIVTDVNVARRTAGGFDQSNDPDAVHGVDVELGSAALEAGASVEGYCVAHPTDLLCVASAPQDKAWCQRLGLPAAVCDENGLRSWFLWALAVTGGTLVGGVVYAAYKTSPLALALGAPAHVEREVDRTLLSPRVAR